MPDSSPLNRWLAAGLVCLGSIGTATAAAPAATPPIGIFAVVVTLDLTQAHFSPTGFTTTGNTAAFSPAYSVDLAVGDTFDFTIHFLGAQTLTLQNPSFLWAYSYATTASQVTGTGQLHLLAADGSAFLSSDPKTDTEGDAHFGQQFNGGNFSGGLPATLTFSGLHYVGTVDAYLEPGVFSRTYNQPEMAFVADSHVVAVPEPASWALMFAGAALIAARRWRRPSR